MFSMSFAETPRIAPKVAGEDVIGPRVLHPSSNTLLQGHPLALELLQFYFGERRFEFGIWINNATNVVALSGTTQYRRFPAKARIGLRVGGKILKKCRPSGGRITPNFLRSA